MTQPSLLLSDDKVILVSITTQSLTDEMTTLIRHNPGHVITLHQSTIIKTTVCPSVIQFLISSIHQDNDKNSKAKYNLGLKMSHLNV